MNEKMFGELLFAMYAAPCLLNGSGYRVPGRTAQDECDLRDYIRLAELSSRQPLRLLLIRLFPKAVEDFAELAKISDPANSDWPLTTVRRYWRALHTGFRNPTTGRTNPNCIPCRSRILGKHHARQDCYLINVDGLEVVTIDYHELHPEVGSFIWAHQHVICEIDDDQTEAGEMESRGGEVIRPQELPTDSSVTVPAMYFTSRSRDFDLVGELPAGRRSLVDEEDPGDVKIGVPATVLSPTTQAQCDCGHECKGEHPCPRAPIMIQTGGPEPVESVLFGNPFDGNPS